MSTSPTPFPAGKTMEELNIDTTRKFVVVDSLLGNFKEGDIIKIDLNDGGTAPRFKRLSDGWTSRIGLNHIAYADEPEVYTPSVGDRVSLEGEITAFPPDEELIDVRIDDRGVCMPWITVSRKAVKLLSRKSPRKVTRKELEEVLGEPFLLVEE